MSSRKNMEISPRGWPSSDLWKDPFFESPPPPFPFEEIHENMNSSFQQFASIFGNYNLSSPRINIESMASDPNALVHSYVASSVTTYKSNGKEKPEVYHAAHSQLTAPGGVKETKKTIQDTRSGLKKMAIGRHLQDKGHVAQRSKNYYTGEEDEKEDLINMDEANLNEFNNDWSKVSNRPDIEKFRNFCSGMHERVHKPVAPQASPRTLPHGNRNSSKLPPLPSSSDLSLDGKKTTLHTGRSSRK